MMSKLYEENLKPSLKDIKANLNSGKHTMLLDAMSMLKLIYTCNTILTNLKLSLFVDLCAGTG